MKKLLFYFYNNTGDGLFRQSNYLWCAIVGVN